eukprot:229844-Prorocentrum_minimum.AAC.1
MCALDLIRPSRCALHSPREPARPQIGGDPPPSGGAPSLGPPLGVPYQRHGAMSSAENCLCREGRPDHHQACGRGIGIITPCYVYVTPREGERARKAPPCYVYVTPREGERARKAPPRY